MGAIDDFLDQYDPQGRPAQAVDPDDATLAALEERFLLATKAVVSPILSAEARDQWRGRRAAQLSGLLSGCIAGLSQVPALAKRLGLSGDEINHAVEADAAACGYIKVLEAVHDGADCGALLLAEQAHQQIRAAMDAAQQALPAMAGPARQSVSACYASFSLAYESAQGQAEASDARSERAAKPLVEKVDALTTRQRVAEAVRTYLEDLKGQATPPVAPPKTAAALRPRKSKKG